MFGTKCVGMLWVSSFQVLNNMNQKVKCLASNPSQWFCSRTQIWSHRTWAKQFFESEPGFNCHTNWCMYMENMSGMTQSNISHLCCHFTSILLVRGGLRRGGGAFSVCPSFLLYTSLSRRKEDTLQIKTASPSNEQKHNPQDQLWSESLL